MTRLLLCRLLGHDWTFPQPSPADIQRWIKSLPPLDPMSHCRRCGIAR